MKTIHNDFFTTKTSVVFIFIIMSSIAAFYLWRFGALGYGNQETLGQFGDYFGGVLNPILSFSAFLVLIHTYRSQVKDSTDNDKKHAEILENSRFFETISMLNDMATGTEVDAKLTDFEGPGGKARSYYKTYTGHRAIGRAWNILNAKISSVKSDDTERRHKMLFHYYKWQEDYIASVESYYDCALFIIDRYVLGNSVIDKKYCSSVLRAQMSTNERSLLLVIIMREPGGSARVAALESLGIWQGCPPIAKELGGFIPGSSQEDLAKGSFPTL
jgi:hypothetical protein